jgi:hypothetical protein
MRRSCRGMDADDCDNVIKTLWNFVGGGPIGTQAAAFDAAR